MEECIVREIKEEIGITIRVLKKGDILTIQNEGRKILLHSFYCSHQSGIPQTLDCHDIRWVKAEELDQYQFPPANKKLIRKLQGIQS